MENNNNNTNDILKAIEEAERLLIEGIGSAEKENVQEGTSRYEQENRQEQLKKDIIWLKKRLEDGDNVQVGKASNRVYTKQIKDYDI